MEIIAEVGQAHDGSLGIAHSYVDAVAASGADTIKFQTHIAEAESSELEPFRVKFSKQDKTRYDYWKRMSFSLEQWKGLKEHCDSVGLNFLSTPFSCAAVDLLEEVGVDRYKLGSGDLSNELLLLKILKTQKPIILSTGMANLDEISKTIALVQSYEVPFTVMQCTTSYPVAVEDIGIHYVKEFGLQYKCPTGLSDHSGSVYPGLYCAANNVDLLEVHIVFSKQMFGPDTSSSLTPEELKHLVDARNYFAQLTNNRVEKGGDDFQALRNMFGRSLAVNKDINKGDVLAFDDLESKKPAGKGLESKNINSLIGKEFARSMKKGDFLTADCFND